MSGSGITLFDRYRNDFVEESVYGEGALMFAYESAPGRFLTNFIFSKPVFSRVYGWLMKQPRSRRKISTFVESYRLNPGEFSRPLDAYASFNDFFCRELKAGSRPIDEDPASVVFPADGRHMGWNSIGMEKQVFVKGQTWNLSGLVGGNQKLVDQFQGGTLVLSRLCPVDYHHFHFPVPGKLLRCWWHGSNLFSVNPIALRRNLSYLWQNKRCLNLIESDSCGTVCFIEIGATNVGSIKHRPLNEDRRFGKGDPKGWFEFGGSSVITLFEPGRIQLSSDLVEMSSLGIELYAHVGDQMGITGTS